MWVGKRRLCVINQLDGRRHEVYKLVLGKSCGMSIVDHVKK